jgi:hypothetical protein
VPLNIRCVAALGLEESGAVWSVLIEKGVGVQGGSVVVVEGWELDL